MSTKNLPLLNARLLFEKIEKAVNRWPKGSAKGGQFAPSGAGGAASGDLFAAPHTASSSAHGILPKGAAYHAQKDDHGNSIVVHAPTPASAPSTWANAGKTATFVPGGKAPDSLNGTKLESWHDAPTDHAGWAKVEGTNHELEADAPFTPHPHKYTAAGVVIEEPDGRVWLTKPTNHFGGYQHTFPKGGAEPGLTLQQNAIKEAHEETGLKIKITGVLGDYERDTSKARIYTAQRVGGTPSDMGWETQAMRLVPREQLHEYLNKPVDKGIASDYQWESPHPSHVKKGRADQPRWPKGSPLGGQFKAAGADGLTAPPKIGSATNPTYQKLADGMHKAAAAGDWKHVQEATAKLDAKVAGHADKGKLNSHDKWAAQAHQYGKQLLAEKEHQTKATASADKINGPESLANWKKYADKPGGSSEGAVYTDKQGQKWLVKSYGDDDMAKSEVLASHLLNAAGAHTAEMKLVDLGGAHKGGLGVASKWIDGAEKLDAGNAAHVMAARKDFAAHAWLANWDSVGLAHDNTVIHGGHAVHIDPGGALEYRAMGGKKGAAFGNTVGELDTMRDASVNPSAKAIYGGMTKSEIAKSAESVTALPHDTIAKLVNTYGPGDATHKAALTAKLLARQQDLAAKLGTPQGEVAHNKPHLDTAPVSAHHSPDIESAAPVKPKISGTAYASIADELEAAHASGNKAAIQLTLHNVPGNTVKGKQVHAYGTALMADLAAKGSKPAAPAADAKPKAPDVDKNTWGHHIDKAEAAHEAGDAATLSAMQSELSGVKSASGLKVKDYATALHEDLLNNHLEAPHEDDEEPVKPARAAKPAAPAPIAQKTALPDFEAHKLGAENTNAPSHNAKVDEIAKLATAGDVNGLLGLKYGTNTYGKKQAAIANDALAALGSAEKVTPGQKKGEHPALTGKPSEPAKPAEPEAPPKTTGHTTTVSEGKKPTLVNVDPAKLPMKPAFVTSNQAVKAENEAHAEALHKIALTGDLAALKAYSNFSTQSSKLTGYKDNLIQSLEAQMPARPKAPLVKNAPPIGTHHATPGHAIAAHAAFFPPVKTTQAHAVESHHKIAAYVVLGRTDAGMIEKAYGKWTGQALDQKLVDEHTAKGDTLTKTQKSDIAKYVGSWSYHANDMMRNQGKIDSEIRSVSKTVHTASLDLAAGTQLKRNLSLPPDGIKGLLAAQKGDIIQSPQFESTANPNGSYGSGKNVQLRLVTAPGVKGIYIGAKLGLGSENEMVMPENSRYAINRVYQEGSKTIVEAVVLPTVRGTLE